MTRNDQPQGKTFKVTGVDGQPVVIPEGEWYISAKARPRRLMKNSLSSEARRIYACLELATIGFRQELAVTMEKGEKIPLTNAHIQDQTGLSKQHVRRGLVELEEAGLAERRGINGAPLHKGRIEIYSWATPRLVEEKNGSHARLPFPEWFPTSWEPIRKLITRHRYRLPEDLGAARDYLPAMETAARDYQRAEMVVTELLERVCAPDFPDRIYRKERNERNIERTSSVSQSVPSVEEERPTDRQDEIHQLLVETLGTKLPGEVPSPVLCKRIDAKLRDAPLPLLRKRIEQRIAKITSMGMVEALADDVGKSWSARKRGPWDSSDPPDPIVEETYLQRRAREIDEARGRAKHG